jgi:hypothetical protein
MHSMFWKYTKNSFTIYKNMSISRTLKLKPQQRFFAGRSRVHGPVTQYDNSAYSNRFKVALQFENCHSHYFFKREVKSFHYNHVQIELAVYCLATSKSSSRYLNNTMRLVEKPFRAGIWIFSRSVKSYCINLKFVIVNKLSLNM